MIKILLFVLCFSATTILCDEEDEFEIIASQARLVDATIYFAQVIQEMIYELEERGWSTLKAHDISHTLNEVTHTQRLVQGQVNYTNGFLISIQKIDISNMAGSLSSRIELIDDVNVTVTTAIIEGRVNFRDALIGHDATVQLNDEDDIRRYTGYFPYTLYQPEFVIRRNMNTNEMTVSGTVLSLSGGSGVRMQFQPEDEISQVISLTFAATSNSAGVRSWVNDVMQPIIVDIIENKIEFPKTCFNC